MDTVPNGKVHLVTTAPVVMPMETVVDRLWDNVVDQVRHRPWLPLIALGVIAITARVILSEESPREAEQVLPQRG